METCYNGIAIPPRVVEACGGDYKSTDCVLSPDALIYLGLPINASQSEINAAVQASLMAKEELIGEIPVADGSETKLIAGNNVLVTGTGTTLDPYIVEAVVPAPVDSRPYKVYSGVVNQVGTNAPVIEVLENTLGDQIVFSYMGQGYYRADLQNGDLPLLAGVMSPQQRTIHVNEQSEGTMLYSIDITPGDGYSFNMYTRQFQGIEDNNLLYQAYLEFRVYN